ncbi:MAG: HAMP domain-containing histidine kinase [Melioribacteraceae bacterium]|nr:HAMP domain-containing histidine kinase [Melioribacteraceae bacterium]
MEKYYCAPNIGNEDLISIVLLFNSEDYPLILFRENALLFVNEAALKFLKLSPNDCSEFNIQKLLISFHRDNIAELNNLINFLSGESNTNELKLHLRHQHFHNETIDCSIKRVDLKAFKLFSIEFTNYFSLQKNHPAGEYEPLDLYYVMNSTIPRCVIDGSIKLIDYNESFAEYFQLKTGIKLRDELLENILNIEGFDDIKLILRSEQRSVVVSKSRILTKSIQICFADIIITKLKNTGWWIFEFINRHEEIRLQNKLKDANNRNARLKSMFFAQMSHEIRTPINAILSFANLIKEEVKDKLDPEYITGFEVINRGGERIIRTINMILDMSEVMTDSYDFIPRELNIFTDVFNEVFMKYRQYALSKGIEFRYMRETENLLVNCDEYMLRQILLNILDNAVKFTTCGSIEVRLYSDIQNKLVIEFADTGIGMSREYIQRVFIPFTQEDEGVNRKYEGNGLGLALTKKYCDINNIDLRIESSKENGTKVTLVFNETVISSDKRNTGNRAMNR